MTASHINSFTSSLAGRRVLVPGGTGGVGAGIVRTYLEAGADVVVPTRSDARGAELRAELGLLGQSPLLHLPTHDYTTFAGAEELGAQMTQRMGGIDDVVAPVGGWRQGRTLTEITEADWQEAFVELATAHMALVRAVVPRLSGVGSYTIVVWSVRELPRSWERPRQHAAGRAVDDAASRRCGGALSARPRTRPRTGSHPLCRRRSGMGIER